MTNIKNACFIFALYFCQKIVEKTSNKIEYTHISLPTLFTVVLSVHAAEDDVVSLLAPTPPVLSIRSFVNAAVTSGICRGLDDFRSQEHLTLLFCGGNII